MSSSEEDMPLAGSRKLNGTAAKSNDVIPKSVDRALDKTQPASSDDAGISIRNGPVRAESSSHINGVAPAKRKARTSNVATYKDATTDSEDGGPINKKRRVSKAKPNDDESESDVPLVSKTQNKNAASGKKPVKASETAIGESEDSDAPLGVKLAKEKKAIQKRAEQEAKSIRKAEKKADLSKATPKRKPQTNGVKREESDEDTPLVKRVAPAKPAKKAQGTTVKRELSSDDDKPISKKARPAQSSSAKQRDAPTPKKSKIKKEETEQDEEAEAEEEEYRWWEDPTKGDGTKKWTTLEHNGVVFPPPYEPLPKSVKMRYDGKPVTMAPDAEEIAGFFGSMLHSTHNVENPTFQKNFFEDFTAKLKESGGAKDRDGNKIAIKDFSKCDFKPIFEYFDAQRAEKKALPAAEKKKQKAEKDEAEAPYLYCKWDGRKQKVGNFRVEPPGLFRGRGEHPKTGRVKKRVLPEQITINVGREARVPVPPEGHRWKEIKHDQEGTWLAMWQENINGAYKYVMLAANSDVKGQSDFNKFEKARDLKKHIDKIRRHYRKELKDDLMANRQRATAMYLIDNFALRAGNEKGEDEADTVGCCSLKMEHVTLEPPNTVIFDFLGKDSIRFYEEFKVDEQVFKNLRIFKKKPKQAGDDIFDRLTTSSLNKHLSNFMPGLTAKVFRTYNASITMSNLLQEMVSKGSIPEKIKDYNEANRKVAILCNHKRTVTAGHAGQMEKLGDRIKGLKYQKWRMGQMMLDVDPKQKKKRGAGFFEMDADLDQGWIQEHQTYLVEEERKKIEKKFQKENEKRVADGEKEFKAKVLEERLEEADDLKKKYQKENKTGKVVAEGKGPTVERFEMAMDKLDKRVATMEVQAEDKENNKEVALGTSKINYIDPRLTVVFSKKFDVPIEKFFSKTLREKFNWAIVSVDEDWTF